MTAVPATRVAEQLISTLLTSGVHDIVVCPGSRSQALALAAAHAEHLDAARVHVRTDERQAGFLALGITHETGAPVAVIVTSGTAVANLTPAVMEADASRMPLILVTADRPPELHGIRANQTAHQAGLFDRFTRESFSLAPEATDSDVSTAARAATRVADGPTQINVQLRDPLSGGDSRLAGLIKQYSHEKPEASGSVHEDARGSVFSLSDTKRTVVIAGAGAGRRAEAFAHEAGVPLLAEVVSGARYGREAIMGYETLIAELGDQIERVIVFGHPTLTRTVNRLLQRADLDVIVVDESGLDPYDPGRNASLVSHAEIGARYNRKTAHSWLGSWIVPDRQLRNERSTVHTPDLEAATATGYKERNAYARAEVAVKREPVTRELLVDTVWRSSWPHDRLVLAASRLVRVLDRVAHPRPVKVTANRGLAGIDGTISTATGVALAQQNADEPSLAAGVTRVIVGDLAFLHDVGALQLGSECPRIQIIVGNDRGGTIFRDLEVQQTANPEDFERVMITPHNVNIAALAEAYGWEYHLAPTRGEFEQIFTAQVSGPTIIEVPLDTEEN
ncbi:MAG: 2-succinyl-5-enolpyruvyl-6-hydroxy-3-cyclohexene-1-carboxylic-acid synthase [Canibacter sp.]